MITNLEKSLADLEKIVQQLEKGDLPLDDSLSLFEKGIQLTQTCQSTLNQAEQKIQTITQHDDSTEDNQ